MSTAARVGIVVLMVLLVLISRLIEAEIVQNQPQAAQAQPGEPSTTPSMDQPPSLQATTRQGQIPTPRSRDRYVVRKGDTLTGISKRLYGTTTRWKDLLAANQRVLGSPRDLRAGQTLSLPPR